MSSSYVKQLGKILIKTAEKNAVISLSPSHSEMSVWNQVELLLISTGF